MPGGDVVARVADLVSAGVTWVQLREKDLGARDLFRLASRVAAGPSPERVLVNDRFDIALACGLGGVHLTGRSLPASAVRRVAPTLLIGVSTHTLAEILRAEEAGANFVVFGPVFDTGKHGYGPGIGIDALLEVLGAVRIPVFALGGINLRNVSRLFERAVTRVAAISMFMEPRDVGVTLRRLQRLSSRQEGYTES